MGGVIWVLYQISYAFQQCKMFENRLKFDKVTESLQVGTFLRHSVYRHFRCGINMAITCKFHLPFAMWSYIWRYTVALYNLISQQVLVQQLQHWNSISILTFWWSYACQSAQACQILSKSPSSWSLAKVGFWVTVAYGQCLCAYQIRSKYLH